MKSVKKWSRLPFWDRVAWSSNDEVCWEWLGAVQSAGYGFITGRLAHRLAYEEMVGPIPEGLVIDHLCCNRTCCNPSHMEVVTREENSRRGEPNRKTRRSGGRPDLKARTHCKWGHEYTDENTRMSGGARICRACVKRRQNEFMARRRENANNENP